MFIKQISVYLENNKGTLHSLTNILSKCNIDLLALSIADTTHFGIVRILVREKDIEQAIQALEENGFVTKTTQVFCIAVQNQSGGLDSVLNIIEQNNITIKYMYSLNYISGNKALIVLRLSSQEIETEQIAKLLIENDIMLASQNEINRL